MTNEQLVARIKAGEDVADNMAQLYEQVKGFIHSIAWKYRDSGELEDLEQEGYLALYPAIDGFNPAAGCKFLTYAEYWIKQGMKRYLQMNGSCLRLPVYCLEKAQQYHRFCNKFHLENGRKPTDRESAAYMGLSVEQVGNIKRSACMLNMSSLEAPIIGTDGGDDSILKDLMGSNENIEEDVLERVQKEQLAAVLWDCVDSLPGEQPEVIRLRYQKGLTLSEIGRWKGSTPETIRQIERKALRKLRVGRCSRRLRPFLEEDEQIYSGALIGCGVGHFDRTWTSSTERVALRLTGE